jgi:hypothetical protein
MSTPSIRPVSRRRQVLPPETPYAETVGAFMVRRLATAIHRERWIAHGTDDQAAHFEALDVEAQFALEGEATEIIQAADPIIAAVARHKAAAAAGITIEQTLDCLAAYRRYLREG